MLVVADINTLWRSRPFAALSELRPVLGLQPMDPLIAVKQGRFPWGTTESSQQKMMLLSVVLPPGWATRNAAKALERLWSTVSERCRAAGAEPSTLVVTSPHYAPLVQKVSVDIPTFHYCSDDYTDYRGWDANKMREQESMLLQQTRHSFFVSASLRDRAVNEYAADPARVSVSMNATEDEFLSPVATRLMDGVMRRFARLKRPIAGVIGGISDRLNFDLIKRVADSPAIGSVLLVGPVVPGSNTPGLDALRRHPKCLFTGQQSHETLPTWLQTLDVALIPFRDSRFNNMCSPMRLFDHLAAGRPIVATNACSQVNEFGSAVGIAESVDGFIDLVTTSCKSDPLHSEMLRSLARSHTWRVRAQTINATINAC